MADKSFPGHRVCSAPSGPSAGSNAVMKGRGSQSDWGSGSGSAATGGGPPRAPCPAGRCGSPASDGTRQPQSTSAHRDAPRSPLCGSTGVCAHAQQLFEAKVRNAQAGAVGLARPPGLPAAHPPQEGTQEAWPAAASRIPAPGPWPADHLQTCVCPPAVAFRQRVGSSWHARTARARPLGTAGLCPLLTVAAPALSRTRDKR